MRFDRWFATLFGSLAISQAAIAAPIKHVVMIVADDMGYADSGITGLKDFATPNIDAIAKAGMVCTKAYVTSAVCSPSRAGFLTGRYQERFGHEHNGEGPPPFGLPTDQVTMGNQFRAAGYATGAIGKWHLGQSLAQHPMSRGFDEFVGFLGGSHPYFPESDRQRADKVLDGFEPAPWNEYLTTYLGHQAAKYIDGHKTQPFFLYLAFNAPHAPLQARESDLAKVANIQDPRRRKYAAMMLALDEAVGGVLDEIKSAGIEDETAVVFFSDNGGPQPGDPSVNGSHNWPFRGGKAQMFDGGIHVPMFLKIPGVLPAGSRYGKPVSSLDLLPTLLALVGKEPIANTPLDGVNLLPFLTGSNTTAPHERLYWRMGAAFAMLQGEWKIVWPRREGGLPENPERPDLTKTQLYHLSQDISEKSNLASEDSQRLSSMIDVWKQWDAELATPLWGSWKDRKPTPAKATRPSPATAEK